MQGPVQSWPFYSDSQLMTAEGLDVWGSYGEVFNAAPLK